MSRDDPYAALAEVLEDLGLEQTAAGYHGLLCGALCAQDAAEIDLLRLVDGNEVIEADAEAVATLERLRESTLAALADMQTGFAPLLPDDADSLAIRARALTEWCDAFVYALAGRQRLDLAACSEEVREIIADFTRFTQAALNHEGDAEVEENAYAELVEYIRVGAQLVFMELRKHRSETTPRTLH